MIVDLFAGPGGWSVALACLGMVEVGFELDATACQTRAAAGLTTVRADVGQYAAERFAGKASGLIASPPCQPFSTAGSKKARGDAARLRSLAVKGHRGWVDPGSDFADARTPLVLEPLRWAHACRPRWVALEQVPTVLPLWQAMSCSLSALGYSVWTGVLNAADYGVPQTRKRAVLLASLDRTVAAPKPTHSGRWVSMTEAVGWTGHVNTGRNWKKGGARADAQKVGCDQPAPTVTGMSGSQWHVVSSPTSHVNASLADLATLQTFPDRYPFAGSTSEAALQIGDAVPPRLAEVLIRAVTDAGQSHSTRDECCTSGDCRHCDGIGYLPDELDAPDCSWCSGSGYMLTGAAR